MAHWESGSRLVGAHGASPNELRMRGVTGVLSLVAKEALDEETNEGIAPPRLSEFQFDLSASSRL